MVGCGKYDKKHPELTRCCGDILFSNKIWVCEECEEKERNSIFINHIKDHLKEGEVVICKICNKSADEIINDALEEQDEVKHGQ